MITHPWGLIVGPVFPFIQVGIHTMLGEVPLNSHLMERSTQQNREAAGVSAVDASTSMIGLAVATVDDEAFFFRTFASTRSGEMTLTGWNVEQQDAFLHMQYEAQRRSYSTQMPRAEYWVIRRGEVAVGRLILDRTPEEIRLVDIALLPEFCNLGIGTALMAAIMGEAATAAKAVRLHVERFNPALQWYERLGFSVVDTGPIYLEMVWRPDAFLSSRCFPTLERAKTNMEGGNVNYSG